MGPRPRPDAQARAQCAGERECAFARPRASGCARPASSVGPRAFSCELPLRACFGLESCGADLGSGSRVCCTAADNNIGDAGATALAAALQKNTTLTEVNLYGARAFSVGRGGWRGWGTLGPTAAARRAGAPNVRGGRERESLCTAARLVPRSPCQKCRAPRVLVCELPLRACFGLESCGADLGLGSRVCCPAAGNFIGADGATALAAALQKNTTVTAVDLGCARGCSGGRRGWRGSGGRWAHGRGPPRRRA